MQRLETSTLILAEQKRQKEEIEAVLGQLEDKRVIQPHYPGTPELYEALVRNKTELALALIKKGNIPMNAFVPPVGNIHNHIGYTLLTTAVIRSETVVVQAMLNAKANIELRNPRDNSTPLSVALLDNCRTQTVECLLNNKADISAEIPGKYTSTVFSLARKAHEELDQALPPKNEHARRQRRVRNDNYDLLMPHCMREDRYNHTLAHVDDRLKADKNYYAKNELKMIIEHTLKHNKIETAIALLKKSKVDVNSFSRSLLFTALEAKIINPSLIQILLYMKANTEVKNDSGETPLEQAIQRELYQEGRYGVIHMLVDAKANVNAENSKGYTPLFKALDCNQPLTMQYLLKNNAYINARAPDHSTLLSRAVQSGHVSMVKLLLDWKASLSLPVNKDVFDIAQAGKDKASAKNEKSNYSQIIQLLRGHTIKARQNIIDLLQNPPTDEIDIDLLFYGSSTLSEDTLSEPLTPALPETSTTDQKSQPSFISCENKHHGKKLSRFHYSPGLSEEQRLATDALLERVGAPRSIFWAEQEEGMPPGPMPTFMFKAISDDKIYLNDSRLHSMNREQGLYSKLTSSVITHLLPDNVTIDGETLLYAAAKQGDYAKVQFLIAARADVNRISSSQTQGLPTPLYAAVKRGHYPIVKALLIARADVDIPLSQGREALLNLAAIEDHYDIVRLLLSANISTRGSLARLLYMAADRDDTKLIQLMIETKANVGMPTPTHHENPLITAVIKGHLPSVKLLLTMDEAKRYFYLGSESLFLRVKSVENLLSEVLSVAVRKGHIDIVKQLVEWQMKTTDFFTQRNNINAALYHAVLENQANIAEYLIGKKADIHQYRSSGNLLCRAVENCHPEIVELLIRAKANPYKSDEIRRSRVNDAFNYLTPLATAKRLQDFLWETKSNPEAEKPLQKIIEILSKAEQAAFSAPKQSRFEQSLIKKFELSFNRLQKKFVKAKNAAKRKHLFKNEQTSEDFKHTGNTASDNKLPRELVTSFLKNAAETLSKHYPADDLLQIAINPAVLTVTHQQKRFTDEKSLTPVEVEKSQIVAEKKERHYDDTIERLLQTKTDSIVEYPVFAKEPQKALLPSVIFANKAQGLRENKPVPQGSAVTPLVKGAEYILLKNKEDENRKNKSAILFAATNGQADDVERLIQFDNFSIYLDMNASVARAAVAEGHTEVVKRLIGCRANIDGGPLNENLLYIAAEKGHREIVTLLLEAGANPHCDQWGFIGNNQQTPRAIAKEKGYQGIVDQLAIAESKFPLENKSMAEQMMWGLLQLSFGEFQRIIDAIKMLSTKRTSSEIKQSARIVYEDFLCLSAAITQVAEAFLQRVNSPEPTHQSSALHSDFSSSMSTHEQTSSTSSKKVANTLLMLAQLRTDNPLSSNSPVPPPPRDNNQTENEVAASALLLFKQPQTQPAVKKRKPSRDSTNEPSLPQQQKRLKHKKSASR